MSIPFTGTIMYLQHEKGIAKSEMSEYLQAYAKKDVVDIIVHKDQIHTILEWEHDREFELSGEMYDVISSQIMGDSIIYQCLHDAKETSINKRILSFIRSYLKDEAGSDASLIVYSDIFKVLHPPISSIVDEHTLMEMRSVFIGYDDSTNPQYFNQPSIPPPRKI
jgi:hypothetical protein